MVFVASLTMLMSGREVGGGIVTTSGLGPVSGVMAMTGGGNRVLVLAVSLIETIRMTFVGSVGLVDAAANNLDG